MTGTRFYDASRDRPKKNSDGALGRTVAVGSMGVHVQRNQSGGACRSGKRWTESCRSPRRSRPSGVVGVAPQRAAIGSQTPVDAAFCGVHGPQTSMHAAFLCIHGPWTSVNAAFLSIHGSRPPVHAAFLCVHGSRLPVDAAFCSINGPQTFIHASFSGIRGLRTVVHAVRTRMRGALLGPGCHQPLVFREHLEGPLDGCRTHADFARKGPVYRQHEEECQAECDAPHRYQGNVKARGG